MPTLKTMRTNQVFEMNSNDSFTDFQRYESESTISIKSQMIPAKKNCSCKANKLHSFDDYLTQFDTCVRNLIASMNNECRKNEQFLKNIQTELSNFFEMGSFLSQLENPVVVLLSIFNRFWFVQISYIYFIEMTQFFSPKPAAVF